MNKYILKKSIHRETLDGLVKYQTLIIRECEFLLKECQELHTIDKWILKRHIKQAKNMRNFYIDLIGGLSW